MNDFTLNDFRRELSTLLQPGLLERLLNCLPGMQAFRETLGNEEAIREARRIVGIIDAMTPGERIAVAGVNAPRRARIARGAGVTEGEVRALIKQYEVMAPIMKRMSNKLERDQLRMGNSWPDSWFDDPNDKEGQ